MRDATVPLAHPASHPTRAFGRFALRRLLGRSVGSMAWLAFDPSLGAEVMLTMPRVQPPDAAALERWNDGVRAAARLVHPNLAPVLEVGVQDHWPYVATGREHGVTLAERLADAASVAPDEAARWIGDVLHGLAYAHDAGLAHHDLQLHAVLVGERGDIRVTALGARGTPAADGDGPAGEAARAVAAASAMDARRLRAQREAATADVLACGLLLHRLLAGTPPLDEPDTALAAARMAPLGRDTVRLPWTTPTPVDEALRAIVNRSTQAQPRLRYHAARTFVGALDGWRAANALDGGGPVALLLDRLQSVGHLPALPGLGARVADITRHEQQRTHQIADQVLEDLALSFELLRTLHSASVQGTQVQGNGPVLTLRRVIALIGVDGVRLAANSLRPWPGPLSDVHATQLKLALARVRLAAFAAQALQPPGYDAQVVYLITVLQNLGRLMLRYHFADEAEQIQQLMKPIPADPATRTPEQPGLGEAAAAFAVLGVDVESLGVAVARHWRLDDEVLHMIRRLPTDAPVRRADDDGDVLRLTANVANEAVDAVTSHPAAQAGAALARVAQRHARALGVDARVLGEAIQAAREAMRRGQTAVPAATAGAAT